jgi:cytochrome c5
MRSPGARRSGEELKVQQGLLKRTSWAIIAPEAACNGLKQHAENKQVDSARMGEGKDFFGCSREMCHEAEIAIRPTPWLTELPCSVLHA